MDAPERIWLPLDSWEVSPCPMDGWEKYTRADLCANAQSRVDQESPDPLDDPRVVALVDVGKRLGRWCADNVQSNQPLDSILRELDAALAAMKGGSDGAKLRYGIDGHSAHATYCSDFRSCRYPFACVYRHWRRHALDGESLAETLQRRRLFVGISNRNRLGRRYDLRAMGQPMTRRASFTKAEP